jgi:PAS domain S-box-containing protein
MFPIVLLILLNVAVLGVIVLVLLELRRLRAVRKSGVESRQIQQLKDLLSAIPDPVIVLDSKGRRVKNHSGNDHGEAAALLDKLPEPERNALNEKVALAIKQRQPGSQRMLLDGRSIMAQIVPLPNAQDEAAVWLRDCTDQEVSATRAGKLAMRNRAILRSAMDGFFVVDENYRFVEVNDSFCRMTGYSPDELLQMKITDLEVKEPANRRADVSPMRTGLHQFATAHRHRDGHIIRLETSVIVLRDDDHKILVGFARDVTERLRDQERLEQLSRQNKQILDCAGEGIYGVDLDGRISFANPAAARMLGWEVHELIGMCAHDLMRRGQAQPAPMLAEGCPICEAVRGGIVRQGVDTMFGRKDGTELTVDFISSPIRQHGQLTGAVVVFRDTSERKRAENERRQLEARIQQSQKLESLGMLAGGLAHDFNNLLLAVLCNASLAIERLPPDSEACAFLNKIVKSGRRASELTRQMLAYAGRARYDVQPLELNSLVEEMVDLVGAALPKQVKVELNLRRICPWWKVTPASSANPDEPVHERRGVARIATRNSLGAHLAGTLSAAELAADYIGNSLAPGDYVCLEVADTGCGMSPAVLARIFDPFFTTKATGRGLGLSALLGIVRSHSGAVRVISAPGQGTTFTLLFPPAAADAGLRPPHQPVTELPPGATILVIDDEEDIREVVQAVLESRGARVLLAKDGAAGIEQFRRCAADISAVLRDMSMPGIGGAAVLEEILAIRPDARVLLSSGFGEEEALARLRDSGAAGFVPKPYTAQALVDRIGAALGARAAPLESAATPVAADKPDSG